MALSKSNIAHRNRKLREEDLREKLRGMGLLQHIVEGIEKMEYADKESLPGIKAATDTRMRLFDKILPDLKAIDASVSGELEVEHSANIPASVKKTLKAALHDSLGG